MARVINPPPPPRGDTGGISRPYRRARYVFALDTVALLMSLAFAIGVLFGTYA